MGRQHIKLAIILAFIAQSQGKSATETDGTSPVLQYLQDYHEVIPNCSYPNIKGVNASKTFKNNRNSCTIHSTSRLL